MKFRTISIFIFVIFLSVTAMAQNHMQAGLNITLGMPQTEFKNNVDNAGIGLTGHFGYNFPNTPFILGANLGFLIYGSESRKEPFSTTIPDVTVDVTTTNSIVNGHILLRVQPQQGKFRPYLDGLIGFNYLFTSTEIQSEWDFDDDVATSTNQDDFTSSLGGGAGIMYRVHEGVNASDEPYEVFIDFGVRYLNGGNAKYLKEGSITREDGKVHYYLNESTTDLVTYRLGVSVNF